MEKGYSKWRKLDNAALAFPLVTGKNDTRVFRFYCQLKETVDGEVLQQALDQTMKKYPLFQAVLRKGLFWFYLERRDIHATVKQEKRPPCSSLYIPDKKSLLFQVSYHNNCINFEVFHGLTDGTGAMNFLEELVQNYLILAHPETELPRVEHEEEITPGDQEEDSFSQYYSSEIPRNKEKKTGSCEIERGEISPFGYGYYRGDSECKRNPCKGTFLWRFHYNSSDCHAALFHTGRDSQKPSEEAGNTDDSGESPKLFSITVYGEFLWMDRSWLCF